MQAVGSEFITAAVSIKDSEGEGGIVMWLRVPGPARFKFLPYFIDFCNCDISDAGGGFYHRNWQMLQKTGEQDHLLALT